MNKQGIIISGGNINEAFALDTLKAVEPEVLIGVDRGLEFLYENHVMPTHIVGDFDSVSPHIIEYYETETKIPIRRFRPEKDASDTEIALRLALDLGVNTLWILGATGTRLDHVMANIQILSIAHARGVKAYLMDVHNRISLEECEVRITKSERFGDYFSIFPFGGVVEELSIEGAKYPLSGYRLSPDSSMCVSNEWKDEEVKITFPQGKILLMETREKVK